MSRRFCVKKYPRKAVYYVYDNVAHVVVSTPWYSFDKAADRAIWYNREDERDQK